MSPWKAETGVGDKAVDTSPQVADGRDGPAASSWGRRTCSPSHVRAVQTAQRGPRAAGK